MPLSWVRCGVALAVSLLVLLAIARPASAQGPAFCCLPNGDCESMTPYQCLVLGGIFLPGAEACPEPCDRSGIGMSQTAARRLAREGKRVRLPLRARRPPPVLSGAGGE